MRHRLLLLLFLPTFGVAGAQVVQFHPFAGWVVPSFLNMHAGTIKFGGSPNLGFNLSMGNSSTVRGFFRNTLFEMHYQYVQTDMTYRFSRENFADQNMGAVQQHTVMLGCTKESGGRTWAGYGGLYFGVVATAPEDIFYNTRTRFTLAASGGCKYAFSKNAGLRLNGQLYLPIWKSGYYARWTTRGFRSGVVTSSLQVIGSLQAGIYFNLVRQP